MVICFLNKINSMNHISRTTQYIVDQFRQIPLVNTISFEKTSEMDYNKANIYPLCNIDIINSRVEDNLLHINYTFTIVEGRDFDNELNNDKLFGTNLIDNLNETHLIGVKFINYFKSLNNYQDIDMEVDSIPELRFVKLKDGALDGVQFNMTFTVENDISGCNSTSEIYPDTYTNENDFFKIYSTKGIKLLDETGEAFRTELGNVFLNKANMSTIDSITHLGIDENGEIVLTNNVVQDVIVDGVTGFAPSQNVVYDKLLTKQNLPTGFISGLPLSIHPTDNTKAIIGTGIYAITDFSVLSAVTVQLIQITTPIEFTPQYLLTNPASYIALDINKNVVQSASPFTNSDRRTLALIGATIHTNNTNINVVNEIKAPIVAPTNQLHDLIKAVGSLNLSGNVFSPNGPNMQINKSAGVIWGLGINAANYLNPHELSLSGQTGLSFAYRLRTGTQYTTTNVIDPNNYDNAGVLASVPNNRFTIQRINLFQSGLCRLQYGQNVYQTMEDARINLSTEPFVTEQNIADNAIFRAYLILKKGVTNLTLAVSNGEAYFVSVDKFGTVVGGSSLSTLQSVYNNSITPQIIVNDTLGPLTLENARSNDAANVQEWKNLSGTTTASVNGSGIIVGSKLVTSGGTSSQFIKGDGTLDSSIISGSYTPTITNVVNATSVTLERASFMKVGNIVNGVLSLIFTTTNGNTLTSFDFNIPIPKTNSTSFSIGAGTSKASVSALLPTEVITVTNNSTGRISFTTGASFGSGGKTIVTFQYDITQ